MILLRRRFIPIYVNFVVELVWNIDIRPPAVGFSVCQDVIWSVTTKIPGWQQNRSVQSSLFASTEEEFTQLFWYLQFYFHIKTSSVSHCLLWSGLFTTVFICIDTALIQYFYIIIHLIHNYQQCNYLIFHDIYSLN